MIKREDGFTLVELIVVATIVGILAAIAAPAYLDYTVRAKTLDAITMSATARLKIAEYYRYQHDFPKDNRQAGIPETIKSSLTASVLVEDGAIQIIFSDKEPELAGKQLTMRPVVSLDYPSTPIYFKCGYGDEEELENGQAYIGEDRTNVDRRYLPSSCR